MQDNKIMAFAITMLMLVGIFAGIATRVDADIINDPSSYIQVGDTNLDNHAWYRGDDVTFYLYVENTGYNDVYHCNVSISDTVLGGDGNPVDSPFLRWDKKAVNDNATIRGYYYYYDGHYFNGFSATIKTSATYGEYILIANITYKDGYGNAYTTQSKITFYIDPMVKVYGDIKACPKGSTSSVTVYIDGYLSINNVYLNITPPDADFTFSGGSSSVGVAHINSLYDTWSPSYVVKVSKTKQMGTYTGKARIEYTYNGYRISDNFDIPFIISPNPVLNMSYIPQYVDRAAGEIRFNISLSNTGNIELKNIKLWIGNDSDDYFSIPEHLSYYMGDKAKLYGGYLWVKSLGVGENTSVSFYAIMDIHTPTGLHKILLDYQASYEYENHSYKVGEDWDYGKPGWYGNSPCMNQYIRKNGYSINVKVKGNMPDFDFVYVDRTVPKIGPAGHDILTYTIVNNEYRSYSDISIYVKTLSTPLSNPDNSSNRWFKAGYLKSIYDQNSVDLELTTDEDAIAGYYKIPVKIDAIDSLTGEKVTSQSTIPIIISGNGARLIVSEKKVMGSVRPDEGFRLNITIKNVGNDAAKNVIVKLSDSQYFTMLGGPETIEEISPGESRSVEIICLASESIEPSKTYVPELNISYDNMFGKAGIQEKEPIGITADSYSDISGMDVLMSATFILILLLAAYLGLLLLTEIKDMKKKPPKKKPLKKSKKPAFETKKKSGKTSNPESKKPNKKKKAKRPPTDTESEDDLPSFGSEDDIVFDMD